MSLTVVGVAVGVAVLRSPRQQAPVVGTAAPPAFAVDDGRGLVGATGAAYSPNGSRLAVKTGGERVGIAEQGRVRPITPDDAEIASFAWRDEQSLYVIEGPSSTGEMVLLDLQGAVKRRLPLQTAFLPGPGLTVAPDGLSAVTVAVERGPLGGRSTGDLQRIDLTNGRVTPLTSSGDDASAPVFLDGDLVACTMADADGTTHVAVIDLSDPSHPGTPVAVPATAAARTVGALQGGEVVYQQARALLARAVGAGAGDTTGEPRRLYAVPESATVAAVDTRAERIVLREPFDDGGTPTNRLREVTP